MLTYDDIKYAICGKGNPDPIGFGMTPLPDDLSDAYGIDRFSNGICFAIEKEKDEMLDLICDLCKRFVSGDHGSCDNSKELLNNKFNTNSSLPIHGYYATKYGEIRIEKRFFGDDCLITIYFDFEE